MQLEKFQLWCATGVNLSGGRTRDGGDIVGASIFYSQTQLDENDEPTKEIDSSEDPDIDKINEELKVWVPSIS